MNNMHFDIIELRQQIDALLIQFPELRDDEVLRADMFEAETHINSILAKLVDLSGEAGAMAEAIKIRATTLADRKSRYERREEAMRTLIQKIMERVELNKIVFPEATLSISFRKPSPIVVDEAAVPDHLCKFKRTPDMAKIKIYIDMTASGVAPPGISMSNGKNILTVRTK